MTRDTNQLCLLTQFIVQSLVGNATWSSVTRSGKFYHVGTIPNKKSNTYVSDLRMMVTGSAQGFRPICIYGRKARLPLTGELEDDADTWDMLGTNLSVKLPDGGWTTDTSRLILMDRKDFNQLGLGIDDLIDAYIQTVLAVIAIDRMATRLMANGEFDYKLFESLNPDNALMNEIREANGDFQFSPLHIHFLSLLYYTFHFTTKNHHLIRAIGV